MRTNVWLGLVTLAALGSASAATLPDFSSVDTDGNGVISMAEARAADLDRAERLDANDDGRIDLLEYRRGQRVRNDGNGPPRESYTDYPPMVR